MKYGHASKVREEDIVVSSRAAIINSGVVRRCVAVGRAAGSENDATTNTPMLMTIHANDNGRPERQIMNHVHVTEDPAAGSR